MVMVDADDDFLLVPMPMAMNQKKNWALFDVLVSPQHADADCDITKDVADGNFWRVDGKFTLSVHRPSRYLSTS